MIKSMKVHLIIRDRVLSELLFITYEIKISPRWIPSLEWFERVQMYQVFTPRP